MINEVIYCDEETAMNLAEIEKLIFNTAWDHKIIKEKINNKRFKYWVYKEEEKIKGYLGIQFLEEEVEILGIGVNPEFRRKKIANDLMEHFIKYFETSKYKKIILEVRESNKIAKDLYSKFGFEYNSKRKKYYVDEDADVLVREKIYA